MELKVNLCLKPFAFYNRILSYIDIINIRIILIKIQNLLILISYSMSQENHNEKQKQHEKQRGFEYRSKQKLQVHPMIQFIATICFDEQSYMPNALIRKIAEQCGQDINEKIMPSILAHMCDYKIHKLMKKVNELKSNKKTMNSLKKIEVSKVLSLQNHQLFTLSNQFPNFGIPQKIQEDELVFFPN